MITLAHVICNGRFVILTGRGSASGSRHCSRKIRVRDLFCLLKLNRDDAGIILDLLFMFMLCLCLPVLFFLTILTETEDNLVTFFRLEF